MEKRKIFKKDTVGVDIASLDNGLYGDRVVVRTNFTEIDTVYNNFNMEIVSSLNKNNSLQSYDTTDANLVQRNLELMVKNRFNFYLDNNLKTLYNGVSNISRYIEEDTDDRVRYHTNRLYLTCEIEQYISKYIQEYLPYLYDIKYYFKNLVDYSSTYYTAYTIATYVYNNIISEMQVDTIEKAHYVNTKLNELVVSFISDMCETIYIVSTEVQKIYVPCGMMEPKILPNQKNISNEPATIKNDNILI